MYCNELELINSDGVDIHFEEIAVMSKQEAKSKTTLYIGAVVLILVILFGIYNKIYHPGIRLLDQMGLMGDSPTAYVIMVVLFVVGFALLYAYMRKA
jgi:hypothetical protein